MSGLTSPIRSVAGGTETFRFVPKLPAGYIISCGGDAGGLTVTKYKLKLPLIASSDKADDKKRIVRAAVRWRAAGVFCLTVES